jgi:hypothetical protein
MSALLTTLAKIATVLTATTLAVIVVFLIAYPIATVLYNLSQ